MSRAELALGSPPEDLAGFPTESIHGYWYRAHSSTNGPWWFACSPEGRFDLTAPNGTCYFASTIAVALRERLGKRLAAARGIPSAHLAATAVSRLRIAVPAIADTCAEQAADFGVTRELGTVTPYDLPRRWASALHAGGWGGLRYWPRFSLEAAYALALFGAAGADASRPGDPMPMSGLEAAKEAGIAVITLPHDIPTVNPPGI